MISVVIGFFKYILDQVTQIRWSLLLGLSIVFSAPVFAQDVDLYLTDHILPGKAIIKMAHDFHDPYMWVLGDNNEVYRVNTLTKQVDDYSAKLQPFANYHFFDIAGSGDEVFTLAAKSVDSTIIITYYNGVLRFPLKEQVLTQINGTVTSIGISSDHTEAAYGYVNDGALLIATDMGFYRFGLDVPFLQWNGSDPSQVYAAGYRAQYFKLFGRFDTTGVNLVPTMATSPGIRFHEGVLRTGPPFGDQINTAYFTLNQVPLSFDYPTPDAFWGTDDGMYHVKLRNNTPYLSAYRHYLDHIKVNKIADIFGLMSLGNDVAKENLLVGTDNGLYYSSSVLHAGRDTSLDNFNLYHYDKLGNAKINFIEVNPRLNESPVCEEGIWVATDDGLYLLRPDYTPHVNTANRINAIHFFNPLQQDTVSKQICEGDTLTATLNDDVTANTIQWFRNGQEIVNEHGKTLSLFQTGEYHALLYDPCGSISVESNHLKVDVIAAPKFTFDYPDTLQYCDSASVTLKTDSNPIYHYRWYANGALSGDTIANIKVTQSGKYKVELSACNGSWVSSKEIQVDLVHLPVPVITAVKTTYCQGDLAPLSIDIPIDGSYTINWYQDGVLMPGNVNLTNISITTTGSYSVILNSTIANCSQSSLPLSVNFISAPVFTFNYPNPLQYCDSASITLRTDYNPAYAYRWYKDGVLTGDLSSSVKVTQSGKYKVELSACTNSWVASKEIQVDLIRLPLPALTANKTIYCEDDEAILSLNLPLNPSYDINWYKDGTLMPATTNITTLRVRSNGNYSVIINSTIADCRQQSSQLSVSFTPAPAFTFNYPALIRQCYGTAVTLKAEGATNYQYRWYKNGILTGDVNTVLVVANSGLYKVEVSSCPGSWVPSAEVQVDLIQLPGAVIKTDKVAYCIGDNARLSVDLPINPGYMIGWYKDGQVMPNNNNQTSINTYDAGIYQVIVTSNLQNSDGSYCSVASVTQEISFNPPPTVSIEKIVITTLCDGQQIDLKAHYSGGTVRWSTGETSDVIAIRNAGDYKLMVNSLSGCQVEDNIKIAYLPLPVFEVKDTSICVYKRETITLKAPAGFIAYAWNGVSGSESYDVSLPQTVSLTITDINGCQATRQIVVANRCAEVIIPNTFTPNNDGVNDTWGIGGLEADESATVKVFNRNGDQVYLSRGYGFAWNGEYHGRKLPAGTYYYIITAKKQSQKFSGWVAILY